MSENKTPKRILIAEALEPSFDDGDLLRYTTLSRDIAQYSHDHPDWQLRLEKSTPGSSEELRAGQQVAAFNLLKSAEKLNTAVTDEARDTWAERFTDASIQLCGKPDAKTAQYLEEHGMGEQYREVATLTREYFERTYDHVFAVLSHRTGPAEIAPPEIVARFDDALDVLAAEYDPDWNEWCAVFQDGGDKLSTFGMAKTVTVGSNRANVPAHELQGLFAHEILVHGLSAVNGYKQSQALGDGLPRYLDFQEGLGGFVEYALNGTIPDKIVDRYVDIAYALGQLDGKQHTRQEMIIRNLARDERRNDAAEIKTNQVDIYKAAVARANRIYRGTRGDQHVGVFTKDIAYYRGFVAVGDYITHQLAAGHSVETIFDYLLQGKFDPRYPTHRAAVGYPLR